MTILGTQVEQSANANFRKPEFLGPDKALLGDLKLSNKNTDAFDEIGITGYVGMEVPFAENWRLSGGSRRNILSSKIGMTSRSFISWACR